LLAATVCGVVSLVPAETSAAPRAAADVGEAEPLHCWWRTSASAVRIGDVFTAVLTCATVETGGLTVVVDRSKFDPVAAQLPPFEVLGGTQARDLLTPDRRFFQYEYNLRLISDAFFNRDVFLPELPISYRLRTTVDGPESSVEGAAQTYALPPIAVRVLSLVPESARDIRDATPGTFAGLDAARFRADMFVRAGMVLSALAVGLALVGFSKSVLERRGGAAATKRLRSDGSILRGVSRELAAVRKERESSGWTPALIGRALAALRVLAAHALGRPLTQRRVQPDAPGSEGTVPLSSTMLRHSNVVVSGAATSHAVARALTETRSGRPDHQAPRLEAIQAALETLTRARFGRDAVDGDGPLDEALASAQRIGRELAFEAGMVGSRMKGLAARALQARLRMRRR
jgi:hypothetical protein